MSNVRKSRYWMTLAYPESQSEDWISKLESTGIRCSISPLHDQDVKENATDRLDDQDNKYGIFKKPHYHILLCFDGPTTYNNVLSICESLGFTCPQQVLSAYGQYWYQIHRFNKDKHYYDDKDRVLLNGCSSLDFEDLPNELLYEMKLFLKDFIVDYSIIRYTDIFDVLDYYYGSVNGVKSDSWIQWDKDFTIDDFKKFVFNNCYLCITILNSVYQKIKVDVKRGNDENQI